MCLAKAYIGAPADGELLAEDIISIRSDGGKLVVTTLFGDQREIQADIKEIDFKGSNVILEKTG